MNDKQAIAEPKNDCNAAVIGLLLAALAPEELIARYNAEQQRNYEEIASKAEKEATEPFRTILAGPMPGGSLPAPKTNGQRFARMTAFSVQVRYFNLGSRLVCNRWPVGYV